MDSSIPASPSGISGLISVFPPETLTGRSMAVVSLTGTSGGRIAPAAGVGSWNPSSSCEGTRPAAAAASATRLVVPLLAVVWM